MKRQETQSFWGWLGGIFLLGLLIFVWIPAWMWRPALPEIEINDYILETHASWQGEMAVIETDTAPDIYIRITPDDATDARANLVVTLNGTVVEDNCSYGAKYFCHKISNESVKDGDNYEVVATNSAGERHATIKVRITAREKIPDPAPVTTVPSATTDTTSTESSSSTGNNNASSSNDTKSPSSSGPSCYHYEAGRCWDDLENEAYSAGYYDHQYGRYGDEFYYNEDCDAACEDILMDAYDEGWYDAGY